LSHFAFLLGAVILPPAGGIRQSRRESCRQSAAAARA
jgi:hypothetical protein